ncbi:hypothetical protein FXO38_14951 [Capsicum annuum]|nr:hypothetical protein FXO38_14951 [Capsicum annuum]
MMKKSHLLEATVASSVPVYIQEDDEMNCWLQSPFDDDDDDDSSFAADFLCTPPCSAAEETPEAALP